MKNWASPGRAGWAIALLLVVGALCAAPGSARAQSGVVTVPQTSAPLPALPPGTPGSQFQGGDGDQADATGLIDWHGLQGPPSRVEHIVDPQAHDDIFTSSKELVPDEWELTTQNGGATPGSGNILDTYRSFELFSGGDAYVYLAFTREAAGGTIYVTFELNQDSSTWTNGAGFRIPCRKTNDVLITFGTSGSTSFVQVARWVSETSDPATGCARTGRLVASALVPNVDVQGSSNTAASGITNYLPGFYGASIPQYRFGETAINLSRVLAGLGEGCSVFGSTWMHSRASLSETADMKDFVPPERFRVRTCKATPSLESAASGIVPARAHGKHRLRRHRVLSQSLGIHDTATLKDGDEPTGSLTFRLYGPGDTSCAGPPVFQYEATVRGNGFYRSGTFQPTAAGTYRWVVEYSGDQFNESAGPTRCGEDSETITISRARPDLTSQASGPTHLRRIRVGSHRRLRTVRVHTARATQDISDAAVLAGGLAPTGTITFRLHGPDDPTCSGTPVLTSRVDVDGNGTYYSDTFTPTRAGTYRWVVTYSGDAFNEPAGPTACGDPTETIVVSPAQPTIETIASPATPVDNPITDSAILSGGANPTGTITFRLYGPDDADCSGTPVHTSTVNVHGNGTYTSSAFTPSRQGTYRWVAAYSGDHDNSPAATRCNDAGENVHVGPPPPVRPALSTTASPAGASAGSPIRDIAHLTGGADPTGAITFELFGPGDDTCAHTPAFVASVTVSGNGDYTSRAFRPRRVGTYHWVARYSGDDGNEPAGPTACSDPAETVTVTQAQPRIRTVAQRFGLVGHTIRDVAFLSGASRPTGTITFRLYGPNDPACSGAPVLEVEQNVVGRNGFYPSPRFRTLAAGTYLWTATYSGDANNRAVATACGESGESTAVLPRVPRLTTSASPPAHLRQDRRVRAAGGEIYDSASLTRTFRGTGEITFDLYGPDDPTCAGPPIFSAVTAVNGDNIYNSERFTPTVSGTYRWRATYSGDANNRPAGPTRCDDPAEHVQVTIPADPELTTSASEAVTLGGAIHDTAFLSGGAAPTGTITFRLYGPDDADCSGRPVFTATVAVAGNVPHASPPFVPTTAGAYRWVARYSGDPRNHAASTACSDPAEAVVVRPPAITPVDPTLTTVAAQLPAGGATLFDTAILSGGIDPTGAITFELFGPDDTTCSRPPVFVTTVPVVGNGAYPSASFAPAAPGTYRWVATYSGDALNAGAGPTACGDPTETVSVSDDPAPLPNPGPNASTSGQTKGAQQHRPRPRPPRPVVTG